MSAIKVGKVIVVSKHWCMDYLVENKCKLICQILNNPNPKSDAIFEISAIQNPYIRFSRSKKPNTFINLQLYYGRHKNMIFKFHRAVRN